MPPILTSARASGSPARPLEPRSRLAHPTVYVAAPSQEALATFRAHIRLFRPLVCTPAATGADGAAARHVHYGWLAKQHRAFGRLLEAPAVASAARKHGRDGKAHYGAPGFYFQAAATCTLGRRQAAEELVSATAAAAVVEGRASAEVATELGVGAAVNPAAETGSVIELLTKAYEHYKQLRHSRMIFFLAAQAR